VPDEQWRAAGARIDALIAAEAAAGPIARERAEDLVRVVTDLYGAGLERLLGVLHDAGALTDDVVEAVAADELIAGLLLVHGLHPLAAATRIERALAGTGVEVIEVTTAGACRLRLPHGHPPAGLEQAIEAAAPEITGIEVEAPRPVIPVEALFSRVGTEPI
jgi:hypothetical protein